LITPLECSLGKMEEVRLTPCSRAFEIYNSPRTLERFYCNFGLNPAYRTELEQAGLHTSGFDSNGAVRILELPKARLFMATLFVPQASSLWNRPHPMFNSLLLSAAEI
jgi:CTP synthase (UTP-ammonia lyase)